MNRDMIKIGSMFDRMDENRFKKKTKSNTNSTLVAQYKVKAVLYNHLLARISGKATGGLFLSQLLYWQGRGTNKDWVYKTIAEFENETLLTRSEQSRAIKRWKELGVLVVEKRGLPQKRHFQVNMERLTELLNECTAKLQNPR